jgi:hypothetical protein
MQDISLAVKVDKRQVKDLSKLVGQVEKQVGALNKIKINLDVTKASKSLKELAADADKAAASLINVATGATKGGEQLSNSLAKLAEQQARLRSAFLNTNDPINQQRFGLGLLVAQYKQLRVEGRALATAGADIFGKTLTDRSGVGNLSKRLKELKELPKTFSGTAQALKEIDFLLNNAVADSEEFKMLIKAQNEALLEQKNIRNALNIEAKFGQRMAAIPKAVATTQYAPGAVGPQPFVPKALLPPSAVKATKDVATNLKSSASDIDEILNLANKLSRPMRTIALQADRAAKSQERFKRKLKESLQLGVGFPLLFGGGPGSIAGGAIGALSGGGFGGQILGSAIGQQVEQLINGISEIGTAIETIDVERLRSAGVRITAELKDQVDLLRESGDLVEARATLEEVVFQQTGALPGVTQDIANAVNLLAAAGKELGLAVGTTLGILGAPVIALLALITKVIADIFKSINTVLSFIGVGIKNIGKSILELANVDVERLEEALKNVNGQLDDIEDRQFENIRASTQKMTSMLEETSLIKRLKIEKDYNTKVENLRLKLGKKLIEIAKKQRKDFDLDPTSSDETLKAAQMVEEGLEMAKVQRQINILRVKDLETAKSLEKQFQLEFDNRNAINQLEIDRNNINAKYEKRIKDINKLGDTEEARSARRLADQQLITDLADAEADARIRGMQASKQLLDQQANFELQLKTIEANTLGAFSGPFGGSQRTAMLDSLALYAEVLEKNREIEIMQEKVFAGEAFQSQVNDLEEAKNQYISYTKEIIEAKLAQEQFNEALALTKPVTDSLVDSLIAVAEGTKSGKEAFADFLRSLASMLVDTAKQMIAQYIAIGVARMFAGVPVQSGPNIKGIQQYIDTPFNAGNYTNAFSGRALGGQVEAGRPYMVGERGPELFVPGAQGNIVPSNAMGSANVVVNVDASGTQAQGDQPNAKALGSAIGAAVQAELIKQKRPGGILA